MASVHLALERGVEGFERWVALKRLLPHLSADEEFVRSFVREAQLACVLSHPNIVRIFELGRVGEDYFISMEYIEGRDIRLLLRQARKVAGPPPLQVTVSLLSELLDALDYAHRKTDSSGRPLGLVHRDVSPSNLLVTTSGHLKIIDFGIAKASSEKQLTATGKIKGKIAYMAPEALRGRRRDARSDLFSVGVIAHELLTARPLFASKNDYRTIERIQNDEVVPPSAYNTNCPPALDEFVLEALAKEPEDRFQSAREMLERLEELAQSLHVHSTNRDVAGWVEWAFSLPIPRHTNTQDATVELPGRKASQAEADDELLDIIWGSGGGPESPLKLAELTALLPADADDLETDPVAPAPTSMLFALGPDSHRGAEIDSEFEGTEPGGLAGRASRTPDVEGDDWRTEPSLDSLDLPSAMFSESGISPLSRPLGGGPPELDPSLPDVSERADDFDDTEPSEIGVPPMSLGEAEAKAKRHAEILSPFDSLPPDEATRVEPDVLASSPKPPGTVTAVKDPDPGESEVILLKPKAKRRITSQTAVPPLPHVEEPSVSVERPPPPRPRPRPSSAPPPAIRRTRLSSAPPPAIRRTRMSSVPPPAVAVPSGVPEPRARESSAPAPILVASALPAPTPAPQPIAVARSEPVVIPEPATPAANRDRRNDRGELSAPPSGFDSVAPGHELSIPPPPSVDSKLPAVLIGLAAAAIIGSVVAFFVWPRSDAEPAPATVADAAPPPTAGLSIAIEPAGVAAAVTVDGQTVSLPARIEPGNRRVRITAGGYMTYVRDLDVVADRPIELSVSLVRENGDAASLALDSTPPGLAVFVDNQPTGQLTPAAVELASGPHAIALRRGDQVVWETALVARPATQHALHPTISAAAQIPVADAGPTVDAGPAATDRTGAPPRIRARSGEEIPASVRAQICIDRRGKVQSVRLHDELAGRIRARVVRAVEKWRYQPYLRDHKPVPTCFDDETIPIQIEK